MHHWPTNDSSLSSARQRSRTPAFEKSDRARPADSRSQLILVARMPCRPALSSMQGALVNKAAIPSYLEIIDFIASGTTPQAVADYHPSSKAQGRLTELIRRDKEGDLSPDEKSELDHFID